MPFDDYTILRRPIVVKYLTIMDHRSLDDIMTISLLKLPFVYLSVCLPTILEFMKNLQGF